MFMNVRHAGACGAGGDDLLRLGVVTSRAVTWDTLDCAHVHACAHMGAGGTHLLGLDVLLHSKLEGGGVWARARLQVPCLCAAGTRFLCCTPASKEAEVIVCIAVNANVDCSHPLH